MQRNMVAGCAAMAIIQAASKIADATEALDGLVRQLDEAAIDAGGSNTDAGRELEGIRGTVMRLSLSGRNLLYLAQVDHLAQRLPDTGYAALEEVVANILAVATPGARLSPRETVERIARLRELREGKEVAA